MEIYNTSSDRDPMSERLLRVIEYVYSEDIKPKNRVCQAGGNSAQWELISTAWQDFSDGIIILHRLFTLLRREEDCFFDGRLLSSAVEGYKKRVLKKLEIKLRSARDVSEANGFARERIEPVISGLWKSLFDDDEAGEATPKVISSDLFQPIFGRSSHGETPTVTLYYPHILRMKILKKERAEAVRLGVELSFHLAESMFLLCDNVRSMLAFCLKLWKGVERDLKRGSPVGERLLRVIHYVYSEHIKPRNGVRRIGGMSVSVQLELIRATWWNLNSAIRVLHKLYLILEVQGLWSDGRAYTSRIEEALEKVEEKFRCAEDVAEANGFTREAMESTITELWKSLCQRNRGSMDSECDEGRDSL